MKFANATNLNRKSGGAKPTCPGVPWRDLRFRGPLLETRNDKGEVGFSRMIRDDSWRLWAGRSGALEGRTADPLGFARDDNKERVVPRKGRLLNRGIFENQFGQV
jgi:hypothetical protein